MPPQRLLFALLQFRGSPPAPEQELRRNSRVVDLITDSFSDVLMRFFSIASGVTRKSDAALFGFPRLIEGLCLRLALSSLLPPDDEASFVTDVSLTADEGAEAALLVDVLCDDDRADPPRRRMSYEGAHASLVMAAVEDEDDDDDIRRPRGRRGGGARPTRRAVSARRKRRRSSSDGAGRAREGRAGE
jgi:hypothetical protein